MRLLELAELDTALDRLAHRRRNLPELAEIQSLEERVGGVRDAIVAAETDISDLDREQRKAEQDVDQVRARAARDQQRLDSGQVSSPRELENLQSEIASLQRRQSDLDSLVARGLETFGHIDADARDTKTVRRHEKALTELPVAIFELGPLHDDKEEWQGSRATLENELAKFPWLTPGALEMFGGRYDPAKLSFAHRLLAALPASPLHGLPASDVRDWTAIRTWASSLAEKLQPALQEA
jgi:uncharacterized protein